MIDNTLIKFSRIGKFVTIQTATEATGYNIRYLRRLLRAGKITQIKIGQVWLIEFVSLEAYLRSKTTSLDNRVVRKINDQSNAFKCGEIQNRYR